MAASTYLTMWQQVPAAVKQFLLKGIILLAIWKVIYLSFLLPARILDAPLTNSVGKLTVWGLNLITHPGDYSSKEEPGRAQDINDGLKSEMQRSVYFHDTKVAGVYDSCNALELMVLYAGFIMCIPAVLQRKWLFAIGGVIIIYVVNVLRCIGVVYAIRYYPHQADFIHHYVFELIIYATIIAMWLLFANKINIKGNARQ